ncbi:MAG TPA: GIY-YIG nuclease family protein [Candidatus Gracilibacteria bacterium]
MSRYYYVYILASGKNGTLYIGVTGNLERRIYQHKTQSVKGFTRKYQIDKLVHFEETDDISAAITREKQLKRWNRKWKMDLIEKDNPLWEDLSEGWFDLDA